MPGKFRPMKFPRSFALLAALAALVLVTGCETYSGHFTKLRVTDQQGDLIAEWVAKGYVLPVDKGYRITAVERLSAPPHAILSKYPEGWRTTVTGPHILRWQCGKPYWLYELEDQ